jgi:hypothetical protein
MAKPEHKQKLHGSPKGLARLALATVSVFLLTVSSHAQQPADKVNSDGAETIIQQSTKTDIRCSITDASKNTSPTTSESNQVMLVTIADQLCKANLLTTKTFKEVKVAIKKGKLSSRSELLEQVYSDAYGKEIGLDSNGDDTITVSGQKVRLSDVSVQIKFEIGGDENDQKKARKIIMEEQKKLLDKLQTTDILSDRAYNTLKQEIVTEQIQWDLQLFNRATVEMATDELLQPAKLDPLLKDLLAISILSVPEDQKISQAVARGEINNPIEIFNYVNRAAMIDLKKLSPEVNQYFPEAYQVISLLLNRNGVANIELKDFKVDIVEDIKESSNQKKFYKSVVTAIDQNRTYQQSGFYDKPKTPDNFFGRLDEEQAVDFFNKILRDRQSAYRLYLIEVKGYDPGLVVSDASQFAVIFLTELQAKEIDSDPNLVLIETEVKKNRSPILKLSGQSHDNSLTSERIDQWLELFQRIDLLSHLTRSQVAVSQQAIKQSYITSPDELLMAFDDLVVIVYYESGNPDNPYQELTRSFAAASRGAFTPTQITNEFDADKQAAGQSFMWRGKQYKIKLEYAGNWLDSKFFDFLETVVAQTVPDGKFYDIFNNGEVGAYIFLTDAQHQALVSAGVLE